MRPDVLPSAGWSIALTLPTGYRLRELRQDDAPRLAELAAASGPYGWSASKFGDALAAGNVGWGVLHDAELSGSVLCLPSGDDWEILDLTVRPHQRRRGLARGLLAAACRAAHAAGAVRVLLEVRASHQAAIALYRGCGFAQIALRPDYYPAASGREDALVMEFRL